MARRNFELRVEVRRTGFRTLGVITAAGRSKCAMNLAPLMGKPLLAYAAEAARNSWRLARLVLSACGLEVPFVASSESLVDHAPAIPVLRHPVRALEARGECFGAVMALRPTNPFRQAQDIDGAIDLMRTTGADSVISFVDVVRPPPPVSARTVFARRLLSPHPAQHSYGIRFPKGADCRAWIVPEKRACSIETPFDLFMAEQLMRAQHADA